MNKKNTRAKTKTSEMKSKKTINLTSFEDHLNKQYGKRGNPKREMYEQEFETFKLGAMMHELRRKKGLTQEALAEKCGTTKTYISRIENNSGDIRISTLVRIIQQGFGGRLRFSVAM
jgi:HTH-type transcriptional regulator/antitoxin HipB